MLAVLVANRTIRSDPHEDFERALARYEERLALHDEAGAAAAKQIFDDESSRIRRLEDKLSGQRRACELVLPFILALVGAALRDRERWVLAVGLLALLAAGSGYFATSPAESAFPYHTPTTEDLSEDLAHDHPARRLAARRLAYVDRNKSRALALNNWISAARVSFVHAVVLLGAALLMFAASRPGPATAPRCQQNQVATGVPSPQKSCP